MAWINYILPKAVENASRLLLEVKPAWTPTKLSKEYQHGQDKAGQDWVISRMALLRLGNYETHAIRKKLLHVFLCKSQG